MTSRLIIAVPAHNEQETIADCIAAVWRSVSIAAAAGRVSRALVTVAAHRCRDATAGYARPALAAGAARFPGVATGLLRIDNSSRTVGQVRAALAAEAGERLPAGPDCWLFNTDADSLVPAEWIVDILDHAASANAVAVAGLVDIADWRTTDLARRRYDAIIRAGLTPTGHRHVYGANLAVRWDAYRSVGGFGSFAHGEDSGLVAALRMAGQPVASVFSPVVSTSSRMPGRAEHGLGSLLGELTNGRDSVIGMRRILQGPHAGSPPQLAPRQP